MRARTCRSRAVSVGQYVRMNVTKQQVSLRDITDANRAEVEGLRVTDTQRNYVASVSQSLVDATENPDAHPWYRAVYSGPTPVGFVMLADGVSEGHPDFAGPYYLWRLLIDQEWQGQGIGRAALDLVVDYVQARPGCTDSAHLCSTGVRGKPNGLLRQLRVHANWRGARRGRAACSPADCLRRRNDASSSPSQHDGHAAQVCRYWLLVSPKGAERMVWVLAGVVTGIAAVAVAAAGLSRWDRGRHVEFRRAGSTWPMSPWFFWGALMVVSVTCVAQPAQALSEAGFTAVIAGWVGLLALALRGVVSTHNHGLTANE